MLRDELAESDEDELIMTIDSVPEELLDVLTICDGQDPMAPTTLFPNALRLLSSKEIVSYYRGFFQYGEKDGTAMKLTNRERVSEHNDCRVKFDRCWQRGWIPFAGSITWLFIDLSPTAKGQAGQIVHWNQDDGFGNVIAHSLQQLIDRIAVKTESGEMISMLDRIPNA